MGKKLKSLAIAICEAATRLRMVSWPQGKLTYSIILVSRAPLVPQGGSNLKIGYSFWTKNWKLQP